MHLDLLWALRWLRKDPAFTAAIIMILAVGIGANTAVFSVVDAVLFRPPSYAAVDRLMRIEQSAKGKVLPGVPVKDFQRWAAGNNFFEKVAPYLRDTVTLTGKGAPEQVIAVRSQGLFPILAVPALLGRTLAKADDEAGSSNVAVLSDRLWRRRYQSDPNVVGGGINISGDNYTIIGVMPPDFEFRYSEAELWTSLRLTASSPWVQVAARLREGVSVSQAQSALAIVAQQMEQDAPKDRSALKLTVTPWQDLPDQKYQQTLIFVLGAVGLVMLIACANVGSLLLSSAVQRQREIAIRASLGAGRWRIVRQLLAESLLLALLGSLAGLLVAQSLLTLLTSQLSALPVVLPHLQRVALNERVLAFNCIMCVLLALLCGIAPILLTARTDLQAVLRGGQATQAPSGSSRLFSTFVALEAALAFMLLAGAGLMIRSLERLRQEDHGFRPDHVLTLRVPVGTLSQPRPTGKYDTRPRQMAFYREILERVKSVPGVKAAGIVNNLPLSGLSTSLNFHLGGPGGKAELISARTISPQYFSAMGIPLLAGRVFADSDQAGSGNVAIINEYLARQLFPHRSPLGERLTTDSNARGPAIVGVVKDSAQLNFEVPPTAEVYIPYQQFMFATFMTTIVVRTEGEPTALANALRTQVWAVDPNQPVVKVETMEEVIANSIWRPRFSAWILTVLSGLSLLLTVAGVYGVVAYTSRLRAREVGIRLALGATATHVLAEIMRGALIPLMSGLCLGLVAALLVSKLLANLLYGVSNSDPLTYLAAGALLLVTGAAASVRPAWRAAAADPIRALRAE